MTPHAKYLIAGATLVTLAVGGAAIARHGTHGFGHHGWRHHGGHMGGPMGLMGAGGRICNGNGAEMADHFLVRMEHKIKPAEQQKAAFEELKTAVKQAAAQVQQACPTKAAAPSPGSEQTPPAISPIERLANAETMTAATLEAIKTVRPAAEKLYAMLNDDQKKALTEFRGHGRRGQGGEWKKRHDRGDGERMDGAPGEPQRN